MTTTTDWSKAQEDASKDVSPVIEAVLMVGTESCSDFTAETLDGDLSTKDEMERAELDDDSWKYHHEMVHGVVSLKNASL